MKECAPGTRVYLLGKPIGIAMFCDSGTVAGPDEDNDGYCIVHLDVPGVYHGNLGYSDPCPDIREAWDNLAPSRLSRFFVCCWHRTLSLPWRLGLVR
jgi:hypothetical protein